MDLRKIVCSSRIDLSGQMCPIYRKKKTRDWSHILYPLCIPLLYLLASCSSGDGGTGGTGSSDEVISPKVPEALNTTSVRSLSFIPQESEVTVGWESVIASLREQLEDDEEIEQVIISWRTSFDSNLLAQFNQESRNSLSTRRLPVGGIGGDQVNQEESDPSRHSPRDIGGDQVNQEGNVGLLRNRHQVVDLDRDGFAFTGEPSGDNCPGDSNPNQADDDNDGYGDVCDPAPNNPLLLIPANRSVVIKWQDSQASQVESWTIRFIDINQQDVTISPDYTFSHNGGSELSAKLNHGDIIGGQTVVLANDKPYRFSVSVVFTDGTMQSLYDFTDPPVILGSNYDGDLIRNLEDEDDDNDGMMDVEEAEPEYILQSAIAGSIEVAGNVTENILGGFANNSEYDFSVEVLIVRGAFRERRNLANGTILLGPNPDNDGLANQDDEDDDNDLLPDSQDIGMVNGRECRLHKDCDRDGLNDNDAEEQQNNSAGESCFLLADCDGDNAIDSLDAFVLDANETEDTDRDGIGNNKDDDIDGDNIANEEDEDQDNDNLKDIFEVVGCDRLVDCDSDGLRDGDEPLACMIVADCDNDTILDGAEVPGCVQSADCDGDTIEDGLEVAQECIISVDCDKDGVEDWAEPARECVLMPDCDHDGLGDSEELGLFYQGLWCGLARDCDKDSLRDYDELSYDRSCINSRDCDGDNISDSVEILSCIFAADCDRDGISDSDEIERRCILDSDCDGDGIADGDEPNVFCSISRDCDKDFLSDSEERLLFNSDGDSCMLLPDCDGDTIFDFDEIFNCVTTVDCDGDRVWDNDEVRRECILNEDCDGDGLDDRVDFCPLMPGGQDDEDGCPDDIDRPDPPDLSDGAGATRVLDEIVLQFRPEPTRVNLDWVNPHLSETIGKIDIYYGEVGEIDQRQLSLIGVMGIFNQYFSIAVPGLQDNTHYNFTIDIIYTAGFGLSASGSIWTGLNSDGDGLRDEDDEDDDNNGILDEDEEEAATSSSCIRVDDCDGDGVLNTVENNLLNASSGISCSMLEDCDGDLVVDGEEAALQCFVKPDCDNDRFADNNDAFPLNPAEWRDDDKDGIGNNNDNCVSVANPDQINTDRAEDGGDACDPDDDNDGFVDTNDAFPLNPAEWRDDDKDGIGNNRDNCVSVANPDQRNTDNDLNGGDACDEDDDNDGFVDSLDAFPLDGTEWEDTDNDKKGNNADPDDDNDDLLDTDPRERLTNVTSGISCSLLIDCDGDGEPDVKDAFPTNPQETADSDGDGIGDNSDNCPLVANPDQINTDGDDDGGDACDNDDDNDGHLDGSDNCPLQYNPDQTVNVCEGDSDSDGVLNHQDNCPMHANPDQNNTDGDDDGGDVCDSDDDNDNYVDIRDNCQFVANPDQINTDGADDGGDACDEDDDNDEVLDNRDNCPLVANPDQINSDRDGDGGDACDEDDDNDQIIDRRDNCPLVANPDQINTDGTDDGGDACDRDDDNDGDPDDSDNCPLIANPDQINTDGTADGGDACDEDDDNDQVVDGRDNCPLVANPNQINTDGTADGGDACDVDDDNDGVFDGRDNCPLVANPNQINTDGTADGGDACDGDDDNDGVADGEDAFPTDPTESKDTDKDGIGDIYDVDVDGDGLIEVGRVAELDAVRYALNGRGRKLSAGAELNTTGCGGMGRIHSCSGYELVANISLAAYSAGKGWQPLGHDTDSSSFGCQGAAFDGIFEGNGRTISNLSISRSDEDCVGLFGRIAAGSEIRNLRLSAEAVMGGLVVGGLVGWGESARIVSSSVVVDEVKGGVIVGGLVGWGHRARIHYSLVEAAEVRGTGDYVGGLVGDGWESRIHSSSVVVDEVSGTSGVGGLVGWGESAWIHSSSVVAAEVRGTGDNAGGLVGWGQGARIRSSSVVVGEMSGSATVGGLAGYFQDGRLAYSYVVSGSSNTAMLVGEGSGATGVASYWDSETSGINSGNHGEARTGDELRRPTDYEDIYASWDDDPNIFDDGDESLAVWCDEDNSGSIEAGEKIKDNLIWDFGTSNEYPAIRCTPIAPAEWRSWWSLDETGKPQLDQTRLEERFSSFSSPGSLEVNLTFAPISGGFRIGNQSAFGNLVSLSITATSKSGSVEEPNINLAEFVDGSYDFIGLDDQSDWTFQIIGTLSDGKQQEVEIAFVWQENREDHASGGIRSGLDTDGDRRADSVDEDDDNDRVGDSSDQCSTGETGWTSNASTDNDGDGCRDAGEDTDDDNDRVGDSSDQCSTGETGWTSNASTDNDRDGCRDESEDTDDDNDGLDDTDEREQQNNLDGVSCSLLADCDGDTVRDINEVAASCVIRADCDNDELRDDNPIEQQENLGGVSCSLLADCDGDTVRDINEVAASCVIRTDCDNDELRDDNPIEQQNNLDGVSCALLADCDGDTVRDIDEVAANCVIRADCDSDEVNDNSDQCSTGETGWTSNASTDNDGDGCRDESEDPDDDNDLVADISDQCRAGETGWTSNSSTDNDGDGCRDEGEDTDDDNDGLDDTDVREQQINSNDVSCSLLADCDGDTVRDIDEVAASCVIRADCDSDGIGDSEGDACPTGETGWTSNSSTDNDGDGCRDDSEDTDDDNDLVADSSDQCSTGETGWTSNGSTDNDRDGCRDTGEDIDDDNDLVADSSDQCSTGETGWTSNSSTDNDGDGCRDESEDTDDDNDGLDDADVREQQNNLDGVSCSLLADCDGDTVRDIDEVAASCVIRADCDSDGVRDGDEAAGCVLDSDCDGDSVLDGADVDDDGDGLIEIATAAELDAVRYALDGRGRKLSSEADIDTTGCGGDGGIRSCSGYELVADISLAAYRDGKGWQPVGNDTDSSSFGCQGAAFDGTFEGNGWMISDLSISRSDEDCVGLFGHVAAGSEIRNLTLRAETVIGREFVGALVGDGESAEIHSSSVVVGEVSGNFVVGGLVGSGGSAQIVSSSVVVGGVRGTDNYVGGLMGYGESAQIHSSSVEASEVSGSGWWVGGLVGDGGRAQIFSSSVVVAEVSGDGLAIGGLVGGGESAQIVSSSVEVDKVSGDGFSIGGLVGRGYLARIYSSSVVAAEVKGDVIGNEVGGLVGGAASAQIHSSSVVVGEVSGDANIGGLVGYGGGADIYSSSAVVGEVSGAGDLGGLVGYGGGADIYSSSAVVGEVSGAGDLGGLVGDFYNGKVAYSYVVSGSNTTMLVGTTINVFDREESGATGVASYWDSDVSGVSSGNNGDPKTTDELRSPIDYTGIYADWDDDTDIFGSEDEPLAVWCDKDNSGSIERGEKTDDNRVWGFGTSSQYPAIRCTPTTPAEWRSWWFLDETGKPQLNRTRLDMLLPSFEAYLTFAPISGGFRIASQSDFGNFVSLNITATSESGSVVERSINIAEFIDGSYDFIGLDDQSDWIFQIIGTLSDGREREVVIVFVWEENEEDHESGGIRPGINTDGDGRADSVDEDDDNDGLDDTDVRERQNNLGGVSCALLADCDGDTVRDIDEVTANCVIEADCDNDRVDDGLDQCSTGETGWTSNTSTDNDGDGCRDADEDIDDDNDGLDDTDAREQQTNSNDVSCSLLADCDDDGVADNSDQCSAGVTDWTSNGSTDNDGDGCRDADEDTDDDNDGLDDTDAREQQTNLGGVSCSLLADCDGDTVRDIDEVAANCVIRADCDHDGVDDGSDQCPTGATGWTSNSSTDNDGDGCRDTDEDTDDDNDGLDDTDAREQQIGLGGVSCSLLVDCDGDTVIDGTDIDVDGDGLIEIATAAELDGVRHALDGRGRRLSETAALDTTGCGGDGGITSCSGYELVADISLAAYSNGKGWQPLGHDTDSSRGACQGVAFDGIFEGNGWTISDLSINRPNQWCVGLFGHVAADSEIRNLTLRAEVVIGRTRVGGLVGFGDLARIDSSLVVVGEVRGDYSVGGLVGRGESARIDSSSVEVAEVSGSGDNVGGLVGHGRWAQIFSSSVEVDEVRSQRRAVGGLVGRGESARIHSPSVVAGEVSGSNDVGGLVGHGRWAQIFSSSVVAAEVSGTGNDYGTGNWVGGLVGAGRSSQIHSSSVVVGEVSGHGSIGGLVGSGRSSQIHSSSVVAGEVSGSGDNVGGLVGYFEDGQVAYSYVVSGSNTPMLVGAGSGTGVASYWDSETSGRNSGNHGEAKTGDELRSPTGYEGIYAAWDDETGIFGDGNNEPLAVWCDKDNSGIIEASERTDDNRIWDFGTSSQYPSIRCTPISPAEWRGWWFLNETGKPQLNQTRLEEILSSFGADLTFAPISGGFRIGNQSDFGNFVSLSIRATSESEVEERNINISEFIDSSYDFIGLDDQSDWTFQIIGTLSDGREREVRIGFIWQENYADHVSGGIRSGLDTDGDRRADSVDGDDDNDRVGDNSDQCSTGETGWTSNGFTDNDRDGCRDESEDADDDNDLVADSSDQCSTGETGWTSNGSTDNDGDGCRDESEDTDDDNDGLDDTDAREQQTNSNDVSCSLLADCDGDTVRDIDEVAANCIIRVDCDNDGVDDDLDQCPTGETGWISNSSTDNDGDGCQDASEDTDDDNDGLDDTDGREQQTNSNDVSCSLLADCDNDGIGDNEGDACPVGETGWTSNSSTDNDGDGCRDESEDADDDNDLVADISDQCSTGETDWLSNGSTDNDGDGCRDTDEDTDDDNDRVDDNSDRCPVGETDWTSNGSTDNDGDGCRDADEDIDDDGDGLIEIGTAVELDAVRYALNSRGRRLSEGAALNTTGCGGAGGITSCSGYELVADISLTAYSDGKGWQPLGHDTDTSNGKCQGAAFDGTFEGNGFVISDLSINRPNQDCVGLFGHTANSEIRNLTIHAETVIGKNRVGGLVGWGESVALRIHSSSVVANEVRGTGDRVGGLVGNGWRSQIHSSSVVANEVSGTYNVGGLVGRGHSVRIVSSSVVVGEVSGSDSVGGLVGDGQSRLGGDDQSAHIFSSSVVANEVRGTGDRVGGLMGDGIYARIVSSSIVVGEVSGTEDVGGLVGYGFGARLAYSYVVSGSNTAMLVGTGSGTGVASYWDSETSGVNSGNHGQAKTSDELRSPTGYEGIYADWDDETDIFGDGNNEPLAVWCDEDNSGSIEADERTDDNRVWDFGTSSQYPTIRCTPITPTEWRSWWYLNGTDKPQLDRTRLDILLSSFEVDLTFAPISGGFRIGNQSDFGYFVSLNIRATSGGEVEERNINIAEFVDSSYDFTGLDDQSDWTFQIIGTLSDGREREVVIVFVWEENEESHNNGGIRPGLDTDGDRRADSVDDDDDNDGVGDSSDDCPTGETSWLSNGSTDNDGDGCQDANEDTDDDNDGLDDREDLCPAGETSWMSNSLTDNDGDGCRDADEDKDGGQNIDDDNDGHRNSVDVDDDGDGLIEIATAEELDAVRYALNGRGRRLSVGADLNTTGCGSDGGITSCSGYELVADISLAAYSDGEGWQPLGNDTDDRFSFGCRGVAFDGIFEGNGWTISDLSINRSSEDCVGLFGHIAEDSEIRNLTLRAEKVIGRRNVGGLVGLGDSVRIFSSSVVAGKVSGSGARVGGLVGWGDSARIFSSSVVAGKVSGNGDRIGGMVGRGDSVRIVSSSVVVDEISGSSGFVGGLVGQGNSARIHSSSVVVGEMSGVGLAIGGLVGDGESAQIVSSSVEVDKVSGRDAFSVGGLVGRGRSARIVSSSVVAAEVKGDGVIGNEVGGLVGDGWRSQIHSSSVVVGEVSGTDGNVGGLVGWGESARIHSSSVVATEVRGTGANVGGLVGYGESARIDSSSVVATEVRGTGTNVGGLVGYFEDGRVAYSYVVSGSDTAMLVGRGSGTGVASYWDSDVSGVSGGNHGEAKTSDELRMPTDYEGIYADWDEDTDIFGSEDEPLAVWCDKDNSGRIEADEKIDDNRIWDFGTSSQYPAIRCTPIRPAEWRSWWSLDEAGKPQLDRTRLDILLSSFEVDLTFAPISGGFRIGNQSDFGDLVSLNIRATSESGVVERTINIAEFIDGSYDFIGLDDRFDWTFWIIGTLSDGREREVVIVFVWEENEEDHQSGGIRPGINTDEDGRADSVDNDDDNDNILDLMDTGMVDGRECRLHEDCDSDGVADNSDQCRVGETGWTSNGSTDNDGDGCRDESEDADDDNDGLDDISDQCSIGETGWTSNSSTDNDGDGCRDTDEDTDDDNDGLDDREDLCPAGETGWTSNSLTDNDGDGCRDADEDEDGGQNIDDDNDGHRNDVDVDDDGDGLIEIATAMELDAVRYALDGNGRRLLEGAELDTSGCGGDGGITSCSGYELVADISLAAYANADGGKGWQPLGNADSSTDGCQGTSFAGAFEGNGWAISDLNINRSDEDCVGLFGNIAEDSEIRNLTLHAETVIGNRRVGGLVGGGRSARIISSSVVANEVRGTYGYVGGLIGDGFGSQLVSSSVVADKVSGTGSIGGLVGDGSSARIISSSVVAAEVRGSESSVGGRLARGARVGGLVGWGNSAQIISSSVVVGAVRGSSNVGGLVGYGTDRNTKIISCSIVVGEVSGRSSVGGLVGDFDDGRVAYSYLVSGSNTDMLVGDGRGIGVASYWDSETSGVNSGNHGQAKTSDELRSPTGYEGIYAAWDDETDIFGDGNNELLAVWCDKDHSGSIEADERTDDNRIWDFGTSSDYPAIRCTPISSAEWRSWWFLDGAGQPQLNQTRLDILLSSFELDLTFAPISGGFRIGNQSDFGDLVSLNIRATSGSEVVERTINIAEFIDGSYDFIGLDDQLDWTFRIIGTLSDGRGREVVIVFVWEENEEDHQSGGIRSGLDTDGDGRADSVDEDDDNDGLDDTDAREQQTNSNDVSCSLLADCDNDGLGDNEGDACPAGETGWTSNSSTDNDGDGCRDESEDADDDNDGLDDTDAREQQIGLGGVSCSLLVDCDGDSVLDEADIDNDGDGLIELATAVELDAVRYALDGNGRRLAETASLDTTGCGGESGITSCSGYELVADISLAAYSDGKGWQPLGNDTSSEAGCQGAAFAGTFEGNGWTISDLNISRPDEDCVGLFGNIAEDSEIRNLTLHAERVIGNRRVGGLVGGGRSARIISSSAVVNEVRGTYGYVGGLIGDGFGSQLVSSSVVAGKVSGTGSIGGLVGFGPLARVVSSSVVANEVSGTSSRVGGLVGGGWESRIHSSSVVVGEVSGSYDVGSLVGDGDLARIHSSSVVAGEVSGAGRVGGLVGDFDDGRVAYSYLVSGSNTAVLVGRERGKTIGVASYWDSDVSGVSSGNNGDPKTTNELRSPTGYEEIYAAWDDETDIFGDGDEPLAVWCDKDHSGSIEADERTDDNRVWNFGTSGEYPAIRCTPISPAEWRGWWFLDGAGQPQLNQTRLDELLP